MGTTCYNNTFDKFTRASKKLSVKLREKDMFFSKNCLTFSGFFTSEETVGSKTNKFIQYSYSKHIARPFCCSSARQLLIAFNSEQSTLLFASVHKALNLIRYMMLTLCWILVFKVTLYIFNHLK